VAPTRLYHLKFNYYYYCYTLARSTIINHLDYNAEVRQERKEIISCLMNVKRSDHPEVQLIYQ